MWKHRGHARKATWTQKDGRTAGPQNGSSTYLRLWPGASASRKVVGERKSAGHTVAPVILENGRKTFGDHKYAQDRGPKHVEAQHYSVTGCSSSGGYFESGTYLAVMRDLKNTHFVSSSLRSGMGTILSVESSLWGWNELSGGPTKKLTTGESSYVIFSSSDSTGILCFFLVQRWNGSKFFGGIRLRCICIK